MKQTYKLLALGAVGTMLIAGLAFVLLTDQDKTLAVGAEAPVVSIQSYGADVSEDAVMVIANVDGESVPLSGITVNICRMNVSGDGEQLTFRVMEMTTLQTGSDGRVMYNFSEGSKYMVYAENQEQRGFTSQNMNGTEANLCYAHQWEWRNMNGQTFICHCQGQDGSASSLSDMKKDVSGDLVQDRVRAQDGSCL
jgi:hypothetical protein